MDDEEHAIELLPALPGCPRCNAMVYLETLDLGRHYRIICLYGRCGYSTEWCRTGREAVLTWKAICVLTQ